MDAFEYNKYKEEDFVNAILAASVIVSYGHISAIDIDTVTVTLAVSDRGKAEKATCVFMNLGNGEFALQLKPALNMRVIVFSPNKAAAGMYESYEQLKQEQGKDFILTGSPAIYSSQFAVCFPLVKATAHALSALIVDSGNMSLELNHDLIADINNAVEIDINNGTAIEFQECTEHSRDYFGKLTETFGMLEGIGGAEKAGTYEYEETYGKYSSVIKNYESGFKAVIGKSYEKPFLTNKGALTDSSAPVTIDLGTGAPVTLTFGASAMTVKMDSSNGLDIALTGSTKVNITAAAGKLKFANSTGSLKDVLNKIADLCATINTTGSPAAQTINPTLAAQFSGELKTLIAAIFE